MMLKKLFTFRPLYQLPCISKQFFYSDKYVQPWEISHRDKTQLADAIHGCHNCRMLGSILKDNLGILTDAHLSYSIYHLYNYQIELDSFFYNEVVPIIKEYVNNFDRECNASLSMLI